MVKLQRSEDLDELFPPAHAEPFTASFFRSAAVKVQWWIFSFILQTSWLEDFNLGIINFRLCKLKRLKVFSLWYPASRARSQSSTNLAYCTDFSPSLAFNGLAGFGTWMIFVPASISCFTNFWLFGLLADTSLLSLLFLDFRTFCL
jgi:hypothetical protein